MASINKLYDKKYENLRILFISQYFPPEMGAPAARAHEVCRQWVKLGVQVTVLTAFPHHPTGVIPPQYKGYWKLRELKDGIKVIRTFVYAAPNKGVVKRMISYFSFMASSIVLGFFMMPQIDVIIASSPQFLCAVSGMVLSFLKRKQFIMEVRDLWPDSVVAVGALKKSHPVVRALYIAEKIVYKAAKKIVIVSEGFRTELLNKGVTNDKIYYVPNGIDSGLFYPRPANAELAKKLGVENCFVVSYIGTHGMAHALETLIDTAELFEKAATRRSNESTEQQAKTAKKVMFMFVGEGARKKAIIDYAASKKLNNCIFIGKIDKEDIPLYYSITDVALVVLKKDPLFTTVLPSKMFEAMGMGKPLILGVEGEAKRVLERGKCGIAVEPENPAQMYEAICRLMTNPEQQTTMGNNGYVFVRAEFDRALLAKRYLEYIC